ncbi:MAG TPA: uroporphyrinogen-III synthase [Methanocorpusculum sp.]|nr:uroporphyrinogen-III synthase [Methanocorpusculum sp.]
MLLAITRLVEKGTTDVALCKQYGHDCRIVSPLRAEIHNNIIQTFAIAAIGCEFDAIFFTSALPAQKIAPHLPINITETTRVIAIGPQTTKELYQAGIIAETLPTYYSRDFVPYLGDWIKGKRIGIPRADVPNQNLINAITAAGGEAFEYRCYSIKPTNQPLDLDDVDAILFTSSNSYKWAIYSQSRIAPHLLMAIGDITANTMRADGHEPNIIGDGSLEGTLKALNTYLRCIR